MTDAPNDPTNRELLERIETLEADRDRLRDCLFDLRRSLEILMPQMIDSARRTNDLLQPVVEKVFPHFREMKDQVDAIVPPCFADPRADRFRQD